MINIDGLIQSIPDFEEHLVRNEAYQFHDMSFSDPGIHSKRERSYFNA